jgi:hypothetical protein
VSVTPIEGSAGATQLAMVNALHHCADISLLATPHSWHRITSNFVFNPLAQKAPPLSRRLNTTKQFELHQQLICTQQEAVKGFWFFIARCFMEPNPWLGTSIQTAKTMQDIREDVYIPSNSQYFEDQWEDIPQPMHHLPHEMDDEEWWDISHQIQASVWAV